MSIFEQIGGPPAVTAAVDDFYRRIIADPALTPYFEGVDMKRLMGHQRAFISAAIGGPDSGASMKEAHSLLHVAPAHFDRVVEHLADTLSDLGVDGPAIEMIEANLAPLRDAVVPDPAARAS